MGVISPAVEDALKLLQPSASCRVRRVRCAAATIQSRSVLLAPLSARTHDRRIRLGAFALVGGFHSPIEQECLAIALRRKLPVIVCVARDLETMRLSSAWTTAINDGRMLLLSTFSPSDRRLTEKRSHERNRFAAMLADEVFIVYADSGSRTEQLSNYARQRGKRLIAPA